MNGYCAHTGGLCEIGCDQYCAKATAAADRRAGMPSAMAAPYGHPMQHLADAHNPQGVKDLQARLAAEPARVMSWQARAAEAGWASVLGTAFTKEHEATFKGQEIVDLRLALAKATRQAQHWNNLMRLIENHTPKGGGYLSLGLFGQPGAYWSIRMDGHMIFAGAEVSLAEAVEAAHSRIFGPPSEEA